MPNIRLSEKRKNYLRNSTEQKRHTGVTFLSVHRRICIINPEDAMIDHFTKEKQTVGGVGTLKLF